MAQRLDDADVRRIAALAHLELSADEVELFSKQLTDILAYVAELQSVDTSGIPPTSHPQAAEPAWRDDAPRPSIDRDAVLAGAPDASPRAGLFKVPKVL
ncbi:MAG: Asp-tRNA(Asn)/Glu-tRNA(Gln) amidotransferase subunit GatC [Acidobacteria bacterium]|nr:Asp-tRNA(Asn)/Glu-tRNA(Gln) amidotransferase subunit GatC [Acidobacteriota bacterium]